MKIIRLVLIAVISLGSSMAMAGIMKLSIDLSGMDYHFDEGPVAIVCMIGDDMDGSHQIRIDNPQGKGTYTFFEVNEPSALDCKVAGAKSHAGALERFICRNAKDGESIVVKQAIVSGRCWPYYNTMLLKKK